MTKNLAEDKKLIFFKIICLKSSRAACHLRAVVCPPLVLTIVFETRIKMKSSSMQSTVTSYKWKAIIQTDYNHLSIRYLCVICVSLNIILSTKKDLIHECWPKIRRNRNVLHSPQKLRKITYPLYDCSAL